ncbi:hypothetical protein, partial [uncultured Desulfovibrio sp.]
SRFRLERSDRRMLVPEESEKIRFFGAGKEEKNFRRECTQVLDQENFSLTPPAPKRLFLTDNCGIAHTAQGRHQPQNIIMPIPRSQP